MLQIKRKLAKRGELKKIYRLYKHLTVTQLSPYDNIYYCCTQKTASQWFKAVFSDSLVYKYTGLEVIPFNQLPNRLQDACFDEPLPRRTINAHLYIDYPTYLAIPKPAKYKTFFILRDPRDIVVSWYFSLRYSHSPNVLINDIKKQLDKLCFSEGLKYSIDKLEEVGLFEVQRSWTSIPRNLENIKVFYYEDFVKNNFSFLKDIFSYLDISMSEKEFTSLCNKYSFEKISGGRKSGLEDINSHYRKGVSGDWKNYFEVSTIAHFKDVTKDLLEVLGYAE